MCVQVPCVYIPHTAPAVTACNKNYLVCVSSCQEKCKREEIRTNKIATIITLKDITISNNKKIIVKTMEKDWQKV